MQTTLFKAAKAWHRIKGDVAARSTSSVVRGFEGGVDDWSAAPRGAASSRARPRTPLPAAACERSGGWVGDEEIWSGPGFGLVTLVLVALVAVVPPSPSGAVAAA